MRSCILIGALLSALLFGVIACESDQTQTIKTDSLSVDTEADQTAWEFEVDFVDSSAKKATLVGKIARIYEDRRETWISGGLTVDFFSEETGEKVSDLRADSAKIDDATNDILAYGDVVVVDDSSNTTLYTDLLMWKNFDRKLYSTEFVRIVTPTEVVEGIGFESDINLENYKIFKVSGEKK